MRPCQGKFRQATWPKIATARKMKSARQETTSLGQITTVTATEADNKRQAFINTDRRRFKIQTGGMGPPPPGRASYMVRKVTFEHDLE